MGGLEVVGSAIAQTRRRNSFVELGRALGGVTSADITELKKLKHPPEGVKAAMVACLVALGFWSDSKLPTWEDAKRLLISASSSQLVLALRSFNPNAITPAMLRKLRPLSERCDPERVRKCSNAAASIAHWVRAVCSYGADQERLLSNYAIFSPRLNSVPYSRLGRFQPWDSAASGPKEIGFCWRTGISERDFTPAEAIEIS